MTTFLVSEMEILTAKTQFCLYVINFVISNHFYSICLTYIPGFPRSNQCVKDI